MNQEQIVSKLHEIRCIDSFDTTVAALGGSGTAKTFDKTPFGEVIKTLAPNGLRFQKALSCEMAGPIKMSEIEKLIEASKCDVPTAKPAIDEAAVSPLLLAMMMHYYLGTIICNDNVLDKDFAAGSRKVTDPQNWPPAQQAIATRLLQLGLIEPETDQTKARLYRGTPQLAHIFKRLRVFTATLLRSCAL